MQLVYRRKKLNPTIPHRKPARLQTAAHSARSSRTDTPSVSVLTRTVRSARFGLCQRASPPGRAAPCGWRAGCAGCCSNLVGDWFLTILAQVRKQDVSTVTVGKLRAVFNAPWVAGRFQPNARTRKYSRKCDRPAPCAKHVPVPRCHS